MKKSDYFSVSGLETSEVQREEVTKLEEEFYRTLLYAVRGSIQTGPFLALMSAPRSDLGFFGRFRPHAISDILFGRIYGPILMLVVYN